MKLHCLYKHHRKTWGRVASHVLTLAKVHPDPVVRLSSVITLAAFNIKGK